MFTTNSKLQPDVCNNKKLNFVLPNNYQPKKSESSVTYDSSQLTVKEVIKQASNIIKKNKPLTDTTNNNIINNQNIINNNLISAEQHIQETHKNMALQSNNYLEQQQHLLSVSQTQQLALNNQVQLQNQLMLPSNYPQYSSCSNQLCTNSNTLSSTSINPSIPTFSPKTYAMAAMFHQHQQNLQNQQNLHNQHLVQQLLSSSQPQSEFCSICGDRVYIFLLLTIFNFNFFFYLLNFIIIFY